LLFPRLSRDPQIVDSRKRLSAGFAEYHRDTATSEAGASCSIFVVGKRYWVSARFGKQIKSFRNALKEACLQARCDKRRQAGWFPLDRGKARQDLSRKTRSVLDRYTIVIERDLLEVAGKLEKHLAEVETDRVKATSWIAEARPS
jgi:hypothetical protein